MRLAVHARRAVILVACLAPRMASAQGDDAENRATARALAQQGAEALEAKDYPKAEDAFRRANALFHAPTLLLGLARAQAAEGKFVEAWESYNQVILDNNTTTPVFQKALDDAKKEIATIDGRRSHVTVKVTGAAAPRVTLDDAALRPEALGVPFFVNPGNHTLAAAADGFNPATRTFSVAEGQATTVSITLEPTAHVAVAPPPAVAAPPLPPRPRRVNHVPAFVAFGVGGAGLVLGVAEGLAALGKHSTLKSECPTSTNCAPSEQATINAYHVAGAVSTVGFIVAGLGAVTGITLFVVENKSAAAAASSGLAVSPYVGLGGAGLSGRF